MPNRELTIARSKLVERKQNPLLAVLRAIALTSMAIATAVVAEAQWVQTAGPYGGYVQKLAASGNNIYVSAYGWCRSTNNGASWDAVNVSGAFVYDIAMSDSRLFALTDAGIYRSTDIGATWSAMYVPLANANIASIFVGGGNLYVEADTFDVDVPRSTDILCSSDDGATWSSVKGLVPRRISSVAMNGSSLFVGTNGGVYVSANDGLTWAPVNSAWRDTKVVALVASGLDLFAGTDGGGMYRSTNNGVTWRAVNSGLTSLNVRSLVVSHGNIVVATLGGAFISANKGESWTSISYGLPRIFVMALAVSGMNLFAGTSGGGVFLSTDNGASWIQASSGLGCPDASVLQPCPSGLLAATDGGVFRTTDDGSSWAPMNAGLENVYVKALAVDGHNLFAGTRGGVYRSTDDGSSWSLVNPGWRNTVVQTLALNGTYLFAGTMGGGVYRSTNNGASWTRTNSGLPNTWVEVLAFDGTTLFAGTDGDGVFLSSDYGANWMLANPDYTGFVCNLIAKNGPHIFVGTTDYGLYHSTDNGVNWISTGLTNYVDGIAFSGENIFVASNDGVSLSTDNGTSWISVNEGLPYTYVHTVAVSGSYVFASLWGGVGVWRRQLSELVKSVETLPHEVPVAFNLAQNYPNPFNPSTTIRFGVPARSRVTLRIYDVLGRLVQEIINEEMEAGYHEKRWTTGVASGMYFYRMEAVSVDRGNKRFVDVRRMILLK